MALEAIVIAMVFVRHLIKLLYGYELLFQDLIQVVIEIQPISVGR